MSSFSRIPGSPQGKSHLLINQPGPQFAFYVLWVNPIAGPLMLLLPFLPVADSFLHSGLMFHPKSSFLACHNEVAQRNGSSRAVKCITCAMCGKALVKLSLIH